MDRVSPSLYREAAQVQLPCSLSPPTPAPGTSLGDLLCFADPGGHHRQQPGHPGDRQLPAGCRRLQAQVSLLFPSPCLAVSCRQMLIRTMTLELPRSNVLEKQQSPGGMSNTTHVLFFFFFPIKIKNPSGMRTSWPCARAWRPTSTACAACWTS